VDRYLAERGYPFKALVAFSGKVEDGGRSYTEAGMNGFPEAQTARTFERPENRFLIVANKFQTGFDQPLLHTMYVDRSSAASTRCRRSRGSTARSLPRRRARWCWISPTKRT
jgi:type I restriction enzyme R subunit